MKAILKIAAIIIGAIITLNGIALFFVSNVNIGNFLTVAMGVAIMLTALLLNRLAKWLKAAIIFCLSVTVIFSSFLIIYGKSDNVTYAEDAVIVLGAAVHGKTPSLTLKRRLDKTVDYHAQNPDAIIIVSGGKGAQEDITEAEAMENYLIDKGVAADKIIKEMQATSTYENFTFSKEILDNHFGDNYTVAFITNEYHTLRASLCAKRAGIKNATHAHSNTNLSYLVSGSLRECLAFIKFTMHNSQCTIIL